MMSFIFHIPSVLARLMEEANEFTPEGFPINK